MLSGAKLRLGDFVKPERSNLETPADLAGGNAAFHDLVKLWRDRLAADHSVKPRT